MNFQKARQPFVVQNGVLAESSRIFALAIGSLGVTGDLRQTKRHELALSARLHRTVFVVFAAAGRQSVRCCAWL